MILLKPVKGVTTIDHSKIVLSNLSTFIKVELKPPLLYFP
jgi:hypothetical protein